jgi:hypothetical protein
LGCFIFLFKHGLFPVFPPQFPDNTLGPKFTVNGGVRAGYAFINTFATVTGQMFLTRNSDFAIRMVFAMHGAPLYAESA